MTSADDDGIVVERGQKGVWDMEAVRVPLVLRERLGDAGVLALSELLDDREDVWRDDVLTMAGERFEKRLAQELGGLRAEIATTRVEMLKWSFLFWIGQVAAMAGLIAGMT